MRIVDAYRNSPAHLNGKPATSGATGAKGTTGPTEESAQKSAGSTGEVKVTMSDEARRLAAKAQDDASRIEKLRDAVQGGTFKVDSRVVARKIVEAGG